MQSACSRFLPYYTLLRMSAFSTCLRLLLALTCFYITVESFTSWYHFAVNYSSSTLVPGMSYTFEVCHAHKLACSATAGRLQLHVARVPVWQAQGLV